MKMYMGQALVLAAESSKGRSNVAGLHDTVGYLLAQNGYEPVAWQDGFDFYSDKPGLRVVALESDGADLYTAVLKDRFRFDEFVEDFHNLKNGTSRQVIKYRNDLEKTGVKVLGAVIGWVGAFATAGYFLENWIVEGHAGWFGAVIGGCAAMMYPRPVEKFFTYRDDRKVAKFKKGQGRKLLPYKRMRFGVEALVEAFPIDSNEVL